MIELNLNGYTDIPSGKVANIATYLEMTERPPSKTDNIKNLALDHMVKPNVARYYKILKAVGEDWLWFSRLALEREALIKAINTPGFEIFILQKESGDIGLLELDVRNKKNIELAYFGLTSDAIGTGAGRWLMNAAITRAFDHHKTKRMFVHTCTMDSPQALPFYQKSGFTPYKRAVEIADDPRLTRHIPREKAGHHPIIE
ncbi:MAG: GNAT family N-acetyltransferase [Hyphomicrobiales bacterium]